MHKTGLIRVSAAIVAMASFIMFNIVPVNALTFSDISGNWARDAILRLASMEIVNGYNGKFNPQAGVTRAEFAAMIVKALGLADEAEAVRGSATGYRDVDPSHWASGFIFVAREQGIISGYPDNTFRPSEPIRRQEITSVLVRALKLEAQADMADPRDIFTDGTDVPNWALESIRTAYGYGLVSGYPDGTFRPVGNATRGETAALIERVLEQLGVDFTFYGKLTKVDPAGMSLTMEIQGQVESFRISPEVQVRMNGVSKVLTDLKLLSNIYVIVSEDGYVTFIQVDDDKKNSAGDYSDVVMTTASYKGAGPGNQALASGSPTSGPPLTNSRSMIILTREGAVQGLADFIRSEGGQPTRVNTEAACITAQVSEGLLTKLKADSRVVDIFPNHEFRAQAAVNPEGEAALPPEEHSPGVSLNIGKEVINSPQFVNLTGSDGKNQCIAIIDTGVDPGHPDLQVTSAETRKIVDWQDFSGEGDVETGSTAAVNGSNVYLPTGKHYLGPITSAGGTVKYGYLRENDFINNDGIGLDLNFNGTETDIFGVLVVDSQLDGVYDTVYVDTDRDNVFADETPLHVFSEMGESASFRDADGLNSLNFVLTTIGPGGTKVNLGFVYDAEDHGTHVAGIAAGNGLVKGVAPGAQVMALKVLDSAGYGNLSTIIEAVTYAASHGANIINLSLSFAADAGGDNTIPAKILNNLSEKYGVLFVTAVGNFGPGLNTVASPGEAEALISVGAFNSPEMWNTDYGWDVPLRSLWFFSAAGPRPDGGLSPAVVAPGSAVSTGPLRKGEHYFLSEGTSMAVPFVSGAAALLRESAGRSGIKVTPERIKRAIETGASPLDNYTPAEQGYGVLDLTKAWARLQAEKDVPKISVLTGTLGGGMGTGVFFRGNDPGRTTLYLQNNSNQQSTLKLAGSSWFKPLQDTVTIPAGKTRAVDVQFQLPSEKGLYSDFLTGIDTVSGKAVSVLVTAINPYELNQENNYAMSFGGALAPARYQRYFVRLPGGADELKVDLGVDNGRGRAKIYLYSPDGRLAAETGDDFAGTDRGQQKDRVSLSAKYPGAGVWEIVVYSSAALSTYHLDRSVYSLTVSLAGTNLGFFQQENRTVTIGVIPKVLKSGRTNYVTVQVREKATKRPYQGFIEVFGRIYFTRGGRVVIPVPALAANTPLVVKTVPGQPGIKPWEFHFTMPTE